MRYGLRLLIFLKEGILDTQGKAVAASLKTLGHQLEDLRVGKYIHIEVEATSEEEARAKARSMCEDLLVNPIIEEYTLELEAPRS